jgi:hypothetical protein
MSWRAPALRADAAFYNTLAFYGVDVQPDVRMGGVSLDGSGYTPAATAQEQASADSSGGLSTGASAAARTPPFCNLRPPAARNSLLAWSPAHPRPPPGSR